MTAESLPQAYFDRLYAGDPDPWGFRTRAYEHDKYEDTLAALDGRRFRRGVEVGCSIGELTARLGLACEDLLGVDLAEAALRQARARNADAPHIRFTQMRLPAARPEGRFDLIVLSEVLYYFGEADLARMADWVCEALEPEGVVLLVHWLGETPDYPAGGDEAVEAFVRRSSPALTTDRRWRRESYRLDRLFRTAPSGPAAVRPG